MNEQEYEQRELAERHHRAAKAARAGQADSEARPAQAAEAATPDAVKEAEVSRQAAISWDSDRKAFSEGPTPPSASQCSTIMPRFREAKSSASSLKEAWKASAPA